jgi:hypothetical protein
MKNKKGSHVGMILSFTLFIVFLIFVYTIIGSPIKTKRENENLFKEIQEKIMEEVSGEVYVTRINPVGILIEKEDCYEFSTPSNNFSKIYSFTLNMDSGEEVGSRIEENLTKINLIRNPLKVYYSTNVFKNNVSFVGKDCKKVEINSTSKEKPILEKKIILLINNMTNNYSLVKEKFGLGGEVDFHIQFEYENGTIIESSKFNEDLKREVFARSFYVDYLNINAREKIGRFIIRVW